MDIPFDRIRLGPFTVAVEKAQYLDGAVGTMDWDGRKIRVIENLSLVPSAEALIHEIFHGLLYLTANNYVFRSGGERNREDEERFINSMVAAFMSFLVDNPKLILWLLDTLTSGLQSHEKVDKESKNGNHTKQRGAR